MFVRQLSSSGFSLASCSHPALSRTASSYLPCAPHPHPWWSAQRFPPHGPRSRPQGHHVFPGRTPPPWSISPVNATGWRSFNSPACLMMDRPTRDREPPHKRRRSTEDKRSVEGGKGQRGGEETGEKNGGSRVDPGSDIYPRPNSRFKDGGRGKRDSGVSQETSIGTDVNRTRAGGEDGQRKHTSSRGETPERGRASCYRGGREDSQPGRFWTQSANSEQDPAPPPRPNPWFREGRSEEQRGSESKRNPWTGQTFNQTQSPPQTPGATRSPPPAQPSLPVRQWQNVKAVKRESSYFHLSDCRLFFPQEQAFSFTFDGVFSLARFILENN